MSINATPPNPPDELDRILTAFAEYCATQGAPFGSMPNDAGKLAEAKAALQSYVEREKAQARLSGKHTSLALLQDFADKNNYDKLMVACWLKSSLLVIETQIAELQAALNKEHKPWKDVKKELLKDPKVKAAYEAPDPEYDTEKAETDRMIGGTPIVEDGELEQPYKSVKRAEAGSVSSSDYKPEYVSDDNTPTIVEDEEELREKISKIAVNGVFIHSVEAQDRIMALIRKDREATCKRYRGVGKYLAASSLQRNIGYLLAHRSQADFPSMTAEVIGNLHKQVGQILDENEKYMLTPTNKQKGKEE